MKNLFVLVFVASSLFATAQGWYNAAVPHGRDINTVKLFNRDSVLIAGGWKLADSTRTILKSENGGLYLWNFAVDANKHWVKSMEFTDNQNGIAVCDGGQILKTSDGGWIWTTSNGPILRDYNRIFFIDNQNMIIVGGINDTAQSPIQTILRSTNGGQSWTVVHDQAGQWLKSVYFPTPSTGYAVGDSGTILKTTNGGANWAPISAPLQRNFNAIWFTDASNGFIVGGYPQNDSIQTILQTIDGGNNWTIKRDLVDDMLRDVHFVNANTGYAVGDDATVLKTTDGGQNWNPVTIPGTLGDEQFNVVRFYSTDFGYVSGKWGRQFIYNEYPAPDATIGGVIVDSSLSVTFTGYVNSHNVPAAHWFVFSNEISFAQAYESAYAGQLKSNTPTLVSETFPAFMPDTTYYYFMKALTMGGTVYTDTLSFYTRPNNARLLTLDATNISQNSATLNGEIKGFPVPLNLFFEYGSDPVFFGMQAVANPASVNDTILRPVRADLTGLQNNTIYYFRLKGVSGNNVYYGNTLSFFTGNQNQLFTAFQALPATSITDTSAVLNGLIEGLTTGADISFEYSEATPSFDQSTFLGTFNDSSLHTLTTPVNGLTPTTLYYFRLKAVTGIGTYFSDTLQFYSGISGNFSVVTKPATNVVPTSAELRGEVRGFTTAIDLTFEYGTTTALGNELTATPANVNDTATHPVTAALSGLLPNTMYYYRLKAEIAAGAEYYGDIRQIYTSLSPIPNWDFQQWEDESFSIPDRWNLIGDEYERVPGRTGNYALRLGKGMFGMLGILYDNGTGGPSFIRGVPFHARPDSISVYANYDIAQGDTAMFLVHLYDAAMNDICTNFYNITGTSNGQFKRLSFPITYNSGLMPDSIVLAFIPTSPTRVARDNLFIIDDIASVPATPIYNHDFENWNDFSKTFLTGWFYPKYVMIDSVSPLFVRQAIFNAPDDYAVEIQNLEFGGSWNGTEISNKNGIFDKSFGGFPVHARHHTLNGFFKWLPENGDSMLIDIGMLLDGELVGQGQFSTATTVNDFTAFDIPISYTSAGVTPDTCIITLRSYTVNPAKGPSRLFVDKLSFDGFVNVEEVIGTGKDLASSVILFPNPASSEITLQFSEDIRRGKVTVYDMKGTAMQTKDFSGTSVTVDTRELEKGIYIATVEEGKERVSKRFIIVR